MTVPADCGSIRRMLCPKCRKENPEGTAICQHCDNILDAAFLGDGYTGEERAAAAAKAAAEKSTVKRRPPPKASPAEGRAPWEESAAPVPGSDYEPDDEVAKERERLRQARQVKPEAPKAMRIDDKKDETYQEAAGTLFADVLEKIKKLWRSYLSLSKQDRLSVGGAIATVFFTFLPWIKIVSAGSLTLMGLQMDGFLLVLLAAAAVTAVVLRQRETWQDKLNILLYGQAGAAGLSLLFILIQMLRMESYVRPDAESLMPATVNLEPGMVLAFAAAAVMAAGCWFSLKPLLKKKK